MKLEKNDENDKKSTTPKSNQPKNQTEKITTSSYTNIMGNVYAAPFIGNMPPELSNNPEWMKLMKSFSETTIDPETQKKLVEHRENRNKVIKQQLEKITNSVDDVKVTIQTGELVFAPQITFAKKDMGDKNTTEKEQSKRHGM